MSYSLLREVYDLKDIYGSFSRAFNTSLNFLTAVESDEGDEWDRMSHTLNSFIIGAISSSSASLETTPLRRSILFPTRMTGT